MVFLKLPLKAQTRTIIVQAKLIKTLNNIFKIIEDLLKNTQISTVITEIILLSAQAQLTSLLFVRIQILITFYQELRQIWVTFIDQIISINNLKLYQQQILFTPLATHITLTITKLIMSHSARIQIISTLQINILTEDLLTTSNTQTMSKMSMFTIEHYRIRFTETITTDDTY